MRSITFVGKESGDGESFRWEVTPHCRRLIIGENDYKAEMELLAEIAQESGTEVVQSGHLYPEEILRAVGCRDDRKYRFTITAEEVNDGST